MVQLVESGDAGPRRTALILYGSETGTAQDVADELDGMARRLRFSTCVKELNAIDLVSSGNQSCHAGTTTDSDWTERSGQP